MTPFNDLTKLLRTLSPERNKALLSKCWDAFEATRNSAEFSDRVSALLREERRHAQEQPMLFCFLDIETTGLEPEKHEVLEIACSMTAEDFSPYASFHRVVHCAKPLEEWDDPAREMHLTSGLVQETQASLLTPEEACEELCNFITAKAGTDKPVMAGNTIHFDRAFLSWHAAWRPAMQLLHHRNMDVSSIRLACKALRNLGWEFKEFGEEKAHRSSEDVLQSIRELKHWISQLTMSATH